MAKPVLFLLLAISLTGCASTHGYFLDRGRDAADIFTATVGYGAGGKVRAGPVQVGLFLNGDMAGLRGGEVVSLSTRRGTRSTLDVVFPVPIPSSASEWPNLTASMESYDLGTLPSKDPKMAADGLGRKSCFAFGRYVPFITISGSLSYYTQLEIAAGLGGTLRLGFNPGELLDFILGWATIDLFSDDLEAGKEDEKAEKERILKRAKKKAVSGEQIAQFVRDSGLVLTPTNVPVLGVSISLPAGFVPSEYFADEFLAKMRGDLDPRGVYLLQMYGLKGEPPDEVEHNLFQLTQCDELTVMSFHAGDVSIPGGSRGTVTHSTRLFHENRWLGVSIRTWANDSLLGPEALIAIAKSIRTIPSPDARDNRTQ